MGDQNMPLIHRLTVFRKGETRILRKAKQHLLKKYSCQFRADRNVI